MIDEFVREVREKILKHDISLDNILNFDETPVYY